MGLGFGTGLDNSILIEVYFNFTHLRHVGLMLDTAMDTDKLTTREGRLGHY